MRHSARGMKRVMQISVAPWGARVTTLTLTKPAETTVMFTVIILVMADLLFRVFQREEFVINIYSMRESNSSVHFLRVSNSR